MNITKNLAELLLRKLKALSQRMDIEIKNTEIQEYNKLIEALLWQSMEERVHALPENIIHTLMLPNYMPVKNREQLIHTYIKNSFPKLNKTHASKNELEIIYKISTHEKRHQDLTSLKNYKNDELEQLEKSLQFIQENDHGLIRMLFVDENTKQWLKIDKEYAENHLHLIDDVEKRLNQIIDRSITEEDFKKEYATNFSACQDRIAQFLKYNEKSMDPLWLALIQLIADWKNKINSISLEASMNDITSSLEKLRNNYLQTVVDQLPLITISNRLKDSSIIDELNQINIQTIGDFLNYLKENILYINVENVAECKVAIDNYRQERAQNFYPRFDIQDLNKDESNLLWCIYIYQHYDKPLIDQINQNIDLVKDIETKAIELFDFTHNVYHYNLLKDEEKSTFDYNYQELLVTLSNFIENCQKIELPGQDVVNESFIKEDFQKNSASYFAVLEQVTGIGKSNQANDLPSHIIDEVNKVDFNTDHLKVTLRPYQLFGAKYILNFKNVLLGDEMGLGKTIQAIGVLNHLFQEGLKHTIVICPLSVLINWMHEIKKWSELNAYNYRDNKKEKTFEKWKKNGGILLSNFEQVKYILNEKGTIKVDTVIVDEAHMIKNPDAKRTKSAETLLKKASYRILMTGTPIENRLTEMKHLIYLLNPSIAKKIIEDISDMDPDLFKEIVSLVYLRRKRDDVLNELPEIEHIEMWSKFSDEEKEFYEEGLMKGVGGLSMMRYAGYTGGSPEKSPKIKQLVDICEEAKNNGSKIIIFSFFKITLDYIEKWIDDQIIGRIQGGVSAEDRQAFIDKLGEAPEGSILLSQIEAGGTGLNMQAADTVILCEPQWKPSIISQAISRVYRMGQTKKVKVYYMLTEDSLDETILDLLDYKQVLFDAYADESLIGENFEQRQLANHPKNEGALNQRVLEKERKRLEIKKKLKAKAHYDNRSSSYSSKATSKTLNAFISFDVETTGFDEKQDKIIEIAAVKFENGEAIEFFSSLVNPKCDIPQAATQVSNIHNQMVKDAPTIDIVMRQFDEFIGDLPVVAHYLEFHLNFISNNYSTIKDTSRNFYCTLDMARNTLSDYEGNHKLESLCEYFDIPLNNWHRAHDDAKAAGELFLALNN